MSNLINRLLPILAMVATLFTSCRKDNNANNNNPVAVSFTSAINISTPIAKAANAAWAPGDKVGIFMVGTSTTTIAESAENRLYTTTGGNTFTAEAGNNIYFPLNGSSVDFIAYYPYLSGQTLSATYPVNVAMQTSQAAIDLLYSNDATAKTKANTNVAMTFYHKLSKVIIITTAGDGLTADNLAAMTVTIKGMNTTATFNLATGLLGAYTTPTDITAFPITIGSKYEAIVLPASFAAGALVMDFTLNNAPKNEVFKRTNTTTEDFEAGKIYTYNVIVKRTGVTFTCTITNWVDAPARNVDAE